MHEHHEARAPLHQAPGEQAIGGEGLGGLLVHAVHFQCGGRFLRKIQQLRGCHLHAESQLVGVDARCNLAIAGLL